jgi:hypothetical protein
MSMNYFFKLKNSQKLLPSLSLIFQFHLSFIFASEVKFLFLFFLVFQLNQLVLLSGCKDTSVFYIPKLFLTFFEIIFPKR